MSGILNLMVANSAPIAAAAAVSQTGIAVTPANAIAQARWNTDGNCETAPTSGIFSVDHVWRTDPVRPSSEFEIELTPTSGSFSSSAAGSGVYVNLGSTQTWARNRTSDTPGSTAVSGTYTIRHAPTGLVVASGTFSLTATVVS